MIVWVWGLSGAGKTTLSQPVIEKWRLAEPNTVLLDGDELRALFGQQDPERDYSIVARRRSVERTVKLCKWLDAQGINAVVASIAMFADVRRENRRLYSSYYEIFLDTSLQTVQQRDPKGLYSKASSGEIRQVVGYDLPFERDPTWDLRIDNNAELTCVDPLVDKIVDEIMNKRRHEQARASA